MALRDGGTLIRMRGKFLYECNECGERFCGACEEDERCPGCGSEDYDKIGDVIER